MKVLEKKIMNASLPAAEGTASSMVGVVNYKINDSRVGEWKSISKKLIVFITHAN